jgi:hypothetical protein
MQSTGSILDAGEALVVDACIGDRERHEVCVSWHGSHTDGVRGSLDLLPAFGEATGRLFAIEIHTGGKLRESDRMGAEGEQIAVG